MSDLFLKNTIDYNFKNVTADIHTMHKTIIDKLNFFIELQSFFYCQFNL